MIFVAIVGDGHQQLPQISLRDVHHLVFTVIVCKVELQYNYIVYDLHSSEDMHSKQKVMC